MRFLFRSCALRVFKAFGEAALLLCAAGAFGQPVVIDGRFLPGEWDGASTYGMTINLPGGASTVGKLYILNDRSNIYIAMRIKESSLRNGGSFSISFDANNDKMINVGDDTQDMNYSSADACHHARNFYDEYSYADGGCPAGAVCTTPDTDIGGTSHGGGSLENDGTWTTYELWHPLSSGDFADMRFGAGSLIRFDLLVVQGLLGSSAVAFTEWPEFPLAEYTAR